MSGRDAEPEINWRLIYAAVLVWLLVMIVLMRLLTGAYA